MDNLIQDLKLKATQIRKDILTTARDCESGVHVGGNLTLAEIMAVVYFHIAKVDPANPNWPERDRIILSKGHGNLALSSAMARRGYFPIEELEKFDTFNSMLSMHIDRHRMPGVEISSGSLGHGLSVAVGAALGGKIDHADWQVYCIISDGELMEGSSWEAILSAAHNHLDNLTVIVDRNNFTIEGGTEENLALEPLDEKIRAFNWMPLCVDGHNIEALLAAFAKKTDRGRPKMIIAKTIKGQGVPSIEGKASSHFLKMKPEDAQAALDLLDLHEE